MLVLPAQVQQEIERLRLEGDAAVQSRDFNRALDCFSTAWNLLPEPRIRWDVATQILAAIGDANFLSGDYLAGRRILSTALTSPNGDANAFIQLRLGQCQLELGDPIAAADHLNRAYAAGGDKVFEGADKYLTFLKARLKPPSGRRL
jgi:tetratricopeptide (TPR) repeat protein